MATIYDLVIIHPLVSYHLERRSHYDDHKITPGRIPTDEI